MMGFGDYAFCGGEVEDERIVYDYRRKGRLLIFGNVPTAVCQQCGEKYFTPECLGWSRAATGGRP